MATNAQIERAARRQSNPHTDFHVDAEHLLVRGSISDADRAMALALLQRKAPDLIHMLGLGGPAPGEPLAPVDVDCPDCTGSVGNRCVNGAGRDVERFHIGRTRLAAAGSSALQEA